MPDFGRFLIKFGKRANIAKGSANEMPKPSIPAVNWYAPPLIDNDPTNKEPSIGPVHEKETSAKVKDMKKMPITPDIEDLDSVFKIHTDKRPRMVVFNSGLKVPSNLKIQKKLQLSLNMQQLQVYLNYR